MSRNKKTPFPPYQTRTSDGIEKRYIRMGNSMMLSPVMLSLNPRSIEVYEYMMLESGGKAIFKYPYSKYRMYCSKNAFQKAVDELTLKGFIEVVEHNKHRCKPNVYRFSDKWKVWTE